MEFVTLNNSIKMPIWEVGVYQITDAKRKVYSFNDS
jgi:hypothetical protein